MSIEEISDIFLIDKKGFIIYSTLKKKDFATNLINGPYSNSELAKLNTKANNLKAKEVLFSDFKAYEPNYNRPTSFIATPVFRKGRRIGNLIAQIPVSRIDSIMNFENKFEESGLGKTGNTFLVGPDYKMKNNYRFIKKLTNSNVKSSGTTVYFYEMKTDSTTDAFKSGKNHKETVNIRGENVLSSFDTFELFNTKWAVIAEINSDEAFEKFKYTNFLLSLVALGVCVLVIFVTIILLNSFVVSPLKNFQNGLLGFFKYLKHDISNPEILDIKSNDEIGQMAKIINANISQI